MELTIVTGLSGAGKSRAVDALEDIGFFCVDNMPLELIVDFVKLTLTSSENRDKVAVVADIRLGKSFSTLFSVFDNLKAMDIQYKVLYIDADSNVIVNRYQETRRKHPLADEYKAISILEAIEAERKLLLPLKQIADYIIDTSLVSSSQFKERIAALFLENSAKSLKIQSVSFGFKYGTPKDADLVFDVRCLTNPFYVKDLKLLTGLDEKVRDFVFSYNDAVILKNKIFDLIDFSIPLYRNEGKSQLTIAIGCTGGKHRSVIFAEDINKHLVENGSDCSVFHRDIKR
ncbi:MAG: RNase adapter RapZ [Oscillospiraceae bacterium]